MHKILFIIDWIYGDTGGTEKQLLLLLNELDKSRFSPHLVCLRSTEYMKQKKWSFPVTIYNVRRSFGLSFFLYLRKFIKLCRSENCTIAQTFFFDANLFGILGAKLAGVKIKIASRRNMGHDLSSTDKIFLSVLSRITDYYLSNSRAVSNYFSHVEKSLPEQRYVIHNGLYCDKFKNITEEYREIQRRKFNISQDTIVVGMVANLRKVKNYGVFIKAADILANKHHNLLFLMVGDGPEESRLKTVIDDLRLSSVIRMIGAQKEIIPILALFDIGVQCSLSESFSNSIMEYMAAGIPSVVSNVGGNSEVLNGQGGFVLKNNTPNELANELSKLIMDEDLRRSLGNEARAYALEAYEHEKVIELYEGFYSRIIANMS